MHIGAELQPGAQCIETARRTEWAQRLAQRTHCGGKPQLTSAPSKLRVFRIGAHTGTVAPSHRARRKSRHGPGGTRDVERHALTAHGCAREITKRRADRANRRPPRWRVQRDRRLHRDHATARQRHAAGGRWRWSCHDTSRDAHVVGHVTIERVRHAGLHTVPRSACTDHGNL